MCVYIYIYTYITKQMNCCNYLKFKRIFVASHSTDVITEEEAVELLKVNQKDKEKREEILRKTGYPAYTTQVGWLGYSNDKVKELCTKFLALGFTSFKVKVGQNLTDDIRRCQLVRETIGYKNKLMLDANQIWSINESIEWMKKLAKFKPTWIEEPTSPDDVLGHLKIANELKPHGIGIATGEMCANRVMFKQLLQARAIDYCQIDSARIGGINEILAVYLMAKKLGGKLHYNTLNMQESFYRNFYFISSSVSSCWRSGFMRNGSTSANVGFYLPECIY